MFTSVSLHSCINCWVLWHVISPIPSEWSDISGRDTITESLFRGLMLVPGVIPKNYKVGYLGYAHLSSAKTISDKKLPLTTGKTNSSSPFPPTREISSDSY